MAPKVPETLPYVALGLLPPSASSVSSFCFDSLFTHIRSVSEHFDALGADEVQRPKTANSRQMCEYQPLGWQ